MRKLLMTTLVALVTVGLGGYAFAAGQTAAKKPAHHSGSATGDIEAYDAAARTLTLKSAGGSTTFQVAADAKVWSGRKSLALDQLSSHTGDKATVTYSESQGQKTTHTIRLAAAPPVKPSK